MVRQVSKLSQFHFMFSFRRGSRSLVCGAGLKAEQRFAVPEPSFEFDQNTPAIVQAARAENVGRRENRIRQLVQRALDRRRRGQAARLSLLGSPRGLDRVAGGFDLLRPRIRMARRRAASFARRATSAAFGFRSRRRTPGRSF